MSDKFTSWVNSFYGNKNTVLITLEKNDDAVFLCKTTSCHSDGRYIVNDAPVYHIWCNDTWKTTTRLSEAYDMYDKFCQEK